MEKQFISCCYYPTTVVLLDDSKTFLADLSDHLKDANLKCKDYDSLAEALDYLQEHVETARSLLKQYTSTEYEPGKAMVSVDIFSFHKKIYNKNRFSMPIAIVVDYSMPEMTGVEFCKQLSGLPFKKIILTGDADENLAVNAFNQGVINGFVKKSDDDYLSKIKAHLVRLNHEYFKDVSDNIITATGDILKNVLYDPVFYEFFNQLIVERNIVEYYLIDQSGSYLLLDDNAKPTWLVVQTEGTIQEYYDIARGEDDVPVVILQLLQDKERIPCFPKPNSENVHPKYWPLYPATQLTGSNNNIYYSMVEKLENFTIDVNEVISYQKFLDMD